MPSASINAKEEIYKILKYQKKMKEQNEQSGGGSKNEDYQEKIQEHRQNLMDAGYKKQEIERMIQKGGQTLDQLLTNAKTVSGKVDEQCEIAKKRDDQLTQELRKTAESATNEITKLQKENNDLKTKHDALQTQTRSVENQDQKIKEVDDVLKKIIENLGKNCQKIPPNPPVLTRVRQADIETTLHQ